MRCLSSHLLLCFLVFIKTSIKALESLDKQAKRMLPSTLPLKKSSVGSAQRPALCHHLKPLPASLLFSTPHMWRYLQGPFFVDRHFVAVDWARSIFSTPGLAVKCRPHFCATTTFNFGLCLNLPLLGVNLGLRGPSEAPEAPQTPLRGPSWLSI